MSSVLVYTNEFGGVSVCVPTGEISISEVQAKDIPDGVVSFIVSDTTLPKADDFFNAWEQTYGVVTVNLSKAKEITKNRLRAERAPLLAAQDVAFQRAQETNADTTAIVAEKKRLRDITKLTDSCTTLDELRALHA
jgi:hypothetical protein